MWRAEMNCHRRPKRCTWRHLPATQAGGKWQSQGGFLPAKTARTRVDRSVQVSSSSSLPLSSSSSTKLSLSRGHQISLHCLITSISITILIRKFRNDTIKVNLKKKDTVLSYISNWFSKCLFVIAGRTPYDECYVNEYYERDNPYN